MLLYKHDVVVAIQTSDYIHSAYVSLVPSIQYGTWNLTFARHSSFYAYTPKIWKIHTFVQLLQ